LGVGTARLLVIHVSFPVVLGDLDNRTTSSRE
jgi:hypothetical protein